MVGLADQPPTIYEFFTVEEHLSFVAEARGAGAEGVPELVKRLGLDPVAKRLIRELSFGYRQRVGLAAALAGETRVILLDETMNGLDPRASRLARDVLVGVARDGATIVMSTHLLGVAERLCTRLVFIDQGKRVREVAGAELDTLVTAGPGALEALPLARRRRARQLNARSLYSLGRARPQATRSRRLARDALLAAAALAGGAGADPLREGSRRGARLVAHRRDRRRRRRGRARTVRALLARELAGARAVADPRRVAVRPRELAGAARRGARRDRARGRRGDTSTGGDPARPGDGGGGARSGGARGPGGGWRSRARSSCRTRRSATIRELAGEAAGGPATVWISLVPAAAAMTIGWWRVAVGALPGRRGADALAGGARGRGWPWLAARPVARTLGDAAREVAALDAVRLAHVDTTGARAAWRRRGARCSASGSSTRRTSRSRAGVIRSSTSRPACIVLVMLGLGVFGHAGAPAHGVPICALLRASRSSSSASGVR